MLARCPAERSDRQGETAASERHAQLLPCPGQAAAHRSDRPVQSTGDLVDGLAFEVTQHHRNPERLRQAVDFLVQAFDLLAGEQCLFGRREAHVPLRIRIPARIDAENSPFLFAVTTEPCLRVPCCPQ